MTTDINGKASRQAETYQEVIARLHRAQKPKSQTPLYLRFVNRRLGGYLAAAGFVRGATPNQMTAVSAAFSLLGILLVAAVPPSWALGIAVALALLIGYAFDSADGQLARLRGGGSPAGEWLDHIVDVVKTCLLHAAVATSIYQFGEGLPPWLLVVPFLFTTVATAATFGAMLRDQLLTGRTNPMVRAPDSVLKSLSLLPIDHGALCIIFVLLGSWWAFLSAYLALAALTALFTLRLLVRTYKVLRASARSAQQAGPLTQAVE